MTEEEKKYYDLKKILSDKSIYKVIICGRNCGRRDTRMTDEEYSKLYNEVKDEPKCDDFLNEVYNELTHDEARKQALIMLGKKLSICPEIDYDTKEESGFFVYYDGHCLEYIGKGHKDYNLIREACAYKIDKPELHKKGLQSL